jgi:hypothetical protein
MAVCCVDSCGHSRGEFCLWTPRRNDKIVVQLMLFPFSSHMIVLPDIL